MLPNLPASASLREGVSILYILAHWPARYGWEGWDTPGARRNLHAWAMHLLALEANA